MIVKRFTKLIVFIPIIAFILSFMMGRYPISPNQLFSILISPIFNINKNFTPQMETIVWGIRLPRVLCAMIVGAALSGAGVSYQGMFRNPLVSPDVLGASAGCGFGAALAIFFSFNTIMIQMMAFSVGLLSVITTYQISKRMKDNQILALILSGILIGSTFSASTSMLKYMADPTDKLPKITFWLMGSLSSISSKEIKFLLIPVLLGLVPLYIFRWKINLLTLDEEEAKSMGVNVRLLRIMVIFCSTLATAGAVCVSGLIGWVGLVVPHLARLLVGPNYKYLFPCALLIGSAYLLLVDDICRVVATMEMPLGVFTSFIGAPFFLFLIFKKKGINQ